MSYLWLLVHRPIMHVASCQVHAHHNAASQLPLLLLQQCREDEGPTARPLTSSYAPEVCSDGPQDVGGDDVACQAVLRPGRHER